MCKTLISVGVALWLVTGCKDDETRKVPFPGGKPGDAAARAAAVEPAARASVPPPMQSTPPSKATEVKPSTTPGMSSVSFGAFAMEVPSSWKSLPASNPMRVAEFELPQSGTDSESPSLVAFFFGAGGGGGVEANLSRWRGQFDEKGDPTPGTTESIDSKTAKVTLLDKTGTFKLQPKMMSPDFTPKPNWRMLAAVVEIDGGPLFFRATGPAGSMAAQRDAIVQALQSIRTSTSN